MLLILQSGDNFLCAVLDQFPKPTTYKSGYPLSRSAYPYLAEKTIKSILELETKHGWMKRGGLGNMPPHQKNAQNLYKLDIILNIKERKANFVGDNFI